MHHFFLPPELIHADQIKFPADIAHQLKRVLRLRDGDVIVVLDNSGMTFETALQFGESGEVYGKIKNTYKTNSEPSIYLSLYVGLTQREKFEWILQKGTELGICRFIPFISERSLVQKTDKDEKKNQRWQKIVREAAEQSKRGKTPLVENRLTFTTAVTQASAEHECCLIPWEEEQKTSLRTALEGQVKTTTRIALMIGPEGGFSPDEVQYARQNGFTSVTFGKRILRMETAALAAAAMVQYHFGQME